MKDERMGVTAQTGREAVAESLGAASPVAELVTRMLGGNLERFFSRYWRKAPLFVPAAASRLKYDVAAFLRDLASHQAPPFVSVGVRDGARYIAKHADICGLRSGIESGEVSSIKVSRAWGAAAAPSEWDWMRTLFGNLSSAVSMLYLGTERSADSDIFLAGPNSSLGSHFDSTDVFNLQLDGERRWRVATVAEPERLLRASRSASWQRGDEVFSEGEVREFFLRPGDALYVPAFCVHHVTGVTWSVSLSLGLRTFNEIDVLEHLIEQWRATRYVEHGVLPSVPSRLGEAHVEAKGEVLRRLKSLLGRLELAAQIAADFPGAVSGLPGAVSEGVEPSLSAGGRS
jgi:hypothetical protein